jgi:ABC-2 type transport system permease protein
VIATIVALSLRATLGRRRTLLLALLAGVPVLLALLLRLGGTTEDPIGGPDSLATNIVNQLMVRTVLPLIALVLGTGVLGSELEDGTAVYLLTKPVPRWQIVLGKAIVAVGVSALFVAPATVLTVVLLGSAANLGPLGFGLTVAAIVGAGVYAVGFLALSLITTRAFIVGLIYTIVWEGVLAGLFEGTSLLSVRQYTLGIEDGLTGGLARSTESVLAPGPAAIGATVVLVVAFAIATLELSRSEIRAAD